MTSSPAPRRDDTTAPRGRRHGRPCASSPGTSRDRPRTAPLLPPQARAPEVLRVGEPRDLVALVPHQLGFVPSRSLVLVSLRGARLRVGLVSRVDLPVLDEHYRALLALRQVPADLVDRVGDLVDNAGDLAARAGASALVAVVYDDAVRPDLLAGGHPGGPDARDRSLAGLVDVLVAGACVARGLRLGDSWWVDGDRLRRLGCREACCPPEGEPLASLDGSLVAVEMVARGSAPLRSRDALLDDLVPAAAAAREEAVRAAATARRRTRRAEGDPGRAARLRLDALASFRGAVEVERLAASAGGAVAGRRGPGEDLHDPVLLGRVGAALSDPWVRDAVLVSCLAGAGDVPEQVAAEGPDERAEALLEAVVGRPAGASVPDPALVAAAEGVLAAVVRHLPDRVGAHALGALAWTAWWSGDGARAVACAERALGVRPAVPMARLVLDLVDAGAVPAWVRARRRDDEEAPAG